DEIRRQRRDAAPIIDPRIEKFLVIGIGEIWRSLDIYIRHKQPGNGYRAQHLAAAWLRPAVHRNFRLGTKILNYDLLNVPIALVEVTDRQQRIDPILRRFPDSNEDAGCERHALLSRVFYDSQALRGNFVGSVVMSCAWSE